MKYGVLVVGPAGSGKSTFCAQLQSHLQTQRRDCDVVNLDPAAESTIYNPVADVRDLVQAEEVAAELGLGPNGALLWAMEFLLQHADWLEQRVFSSADDSLTLFDCPGQIELFTHLPLVTQLTQTLQNWGFRLAVCCCLDVSFVSDACKFLAGSLVSLSTMLQLSLPHVNLLTKCDLLVHPNAFFHKKQNLHRLAGLHTRRDRDEETSDSEGDAVVDTRALRRRMQGRPSAKAKRTNERAPRSQKPVARNAQPEAERGVAGRGRRRDNESDLGKQLQSETQRFLTATACRPEAHTGGRATTEAAGGVSSISSSSQGTSGSGDRETHGETGNTEGSGASEESQQRSAGRRGADADAGRGGGQRGAHTGVVRFPENCEGRKRLEESVGNMLGKNAQAAAEGETGPRSSDLNGAWEDQGSGRRRRGSEEVSRLSQEWSRGEVRQEKQSNEEEQQQRQQELLRDSDEECRHELRESAGSEAAGSQGSEGSEYESDNTEGGFEGFGGEDRECFRSHMEKAEKAGNRVDKRDLKTMKKSVRARSSGSCFSRGFGFLPYGVQDDAHYDEDDTAYTKEEMEVKEKAIEDLLSRDPQDLLEELDETTPPKFRSLNAAFASLLEDYNLVSFLPCDVSDENSLSTVCGVIEHTLQYGEDAEVRDYDIPPMAA